MVTTHKKQLRQSFKAQRATITPSARRRASEAIARIVSATPTWQAAKTVASFLPMGSEIDTQFIDTRAREAGKNVVYPRITGPGEMAFHHWEPGQPLTVTALGTSEPDADSLRCASADLDFVLVPLLACDDCGFRLGYGGGYYDRLLAQTSGFSCGVGYSFQRLSSLPREDHDRALQSFVSETGIERF